MRILAAFFSQIVRALILSLVGAALLVEGAPTSAFAREKPAEKAQAKDPGKSKDAGKGKELAKESAKDKAAAKGKPKAKDDAAPDEGGDPSNAKGKKKEAKGKSGSGKPEAIGVFGDWGAYVAEGKDKTCYALGQPKERQPKAKLKDVTAYVFISTRPGEGVKNEVAINLGYATKDGGGASAEIDGDGFDLVTKGVNAWVKNPAEEPKFVAALKNGSKLVVKASSSKGVASTDVYSLKGLSDALAHVQQECK